MNARRTFFRLAPYAILAAFLFRKNEDFDTWFHLGVGRWIWDHHQVPQLDPFSWTAAARPYIDSHWLFQSVLYPFFTLGGIPLLVVLQALAFITAFWCLDRSLPRPRPHGVWEPCLLLAVVCVADRFLLRPETFTFLFMAFFWKRLFGSARALSWKDGAVLIACQVVWLNVHGLFLFGVAFYGFYAAGALVARFIPLPRGWRDQEDVHTPLGRLVGIGLGLVAACVASPYGLDALRYAWLLYAETRHATGGFMPTVAELAKTSSIFRLEPSLLAFQGLSIVTALSAWLNRRALRLSSTGLVAIFFALAQLTIRNTTYFCFLAAPFAAQNLIQWYRARQETGRSFVIADRVQKWIVRGACAMTLLALWAIVSDRYYLATRQDTRFGWTRTDFGRLDGALQFVDTHKMEGRFLNDILFGGSILWHWSPQRKLFVDGRLEVYGEDFLSEYKRVMDTPTIFWKPYAEKYAFDFVMLSVLSPYSRQLISYLREQAGWPLVFADDSAVVFIRRERLPQALRNIEPFIVAPPGTSNEGAVNPWQRFWRHPFPLRDLALGRLALLLGQGETAKAWNESALWIWPHCPEALFNLGSIAFGDKKWDEATAYNRRILARRPFDADSMFMLGAIALQEKNLPEAQRWLEKAVWWKPGLSGGWSSLGLIHLIQNRNTEARDSLERALTGGSNDADLHNNLGVAYHRLGENAKAIQEFKQALLLDPHNASARQSLQMLLTAR